MNRSARRCRARQSWPAALRCMFCEEVPTEDEGAWAVWPRPDNVLAFTMQLVLPTSAAVLQANSLAGRIACRPCVTARNDGLPPGAEPDGEP